MTLFIISHKASPRVIVYASYSEEWIKAKWACDCGGPKGKMEIKKFIEAGDEQ